MKEYWVEHEHTITVTQGRKVMARSLASAEKLGKTHWEGFPDELVDNNAIAYKVRGPISTRTRRM